MSRNRPCSCKFYLQLRHFGALVAGKSDQCAKPTSEWLTHPTTRSQTAFIKCSSRPGHLISPLSLTKWRRGLLNLSAMQPVVVGSKTGSLYSVHDPRTAKSKGHNEYQFYSATLISMKAIALSSKQMRLTCRSPAPVLSPATAIFFSGLNTVHYLHYLHRVSVLPACQTTS